MVLRVKLAAVGLPELPQELLIAFRHFAQLGTDSFQPMRPLTVNLSLPPSNPSVMTFSERVKMAWLVGVGHARPLRGACVA